jgi:hypothetical protein
MSNKRGNKKNKTREEDEESSSESSQTDREFFLQLIKKEREYFEEKSLQQYEDMKLFFSQIFQQNQRQTQVENQELIKKTIEEANEERYSLQDDVFQRGFERLEQKLDQQFQEKAATFEKQVEFHLDRTSQELETFTAEIVESNTAVKKQDKDGMEDLIKRVAEIERNLLRNEKKSPREVPSLFNPTDYIQRHGPIGSLQTEDSSGREEKGDKKEEVRYNKAGSWELMMGNLKKGYSDPDMPKPPRRLNMDDGEEEDMTKDLRRDSIYGKLLDDDKRAAFDGTRLTLESDQHREIIWRDRSVDGFMVFLARIFHFTKLYEQKVPNIYTHIAESIQQDIAGLLTM